MRYSSVAIVLLAALGIYLGFFGGAAGLIPGGLALLWIAALWRWETGRRGAGVWVLLFLWVLVVPAVTISAQVELLGVITDGYRYAGVFAGGDAGSCTQIVQSTYDKEWACPLNATLPTLLPGLLNLIPLLGVLSSARDVRRAAIVAGGLGLTRFLVPVVIYAAQGDTVTIIGSWQAPPAMGSMASAYTSLLLWLATLVTLVIFAVWQRWELLRAGPTEHGSAEAATRRR